MGEYATPIRTLQLMHSSMIAGLTEENARRQAEDFKKYVDEILVSSNIPEDQRGACKVILFDGKFHNNETKNAKLELINSHFSILIDEMGCPPDVFVKH